MKKIIKIILYTAISCIALSVQSEEDDCKKKNSEAYCILEIAGISKSARDMRQSDLKNKDIDISKIGSDGVIHIDTNYLALAALEHINPTKIAGLSSGTLGSAFLVASIFSPRNPGEISDTFAIIPDSEVIDGNVLKTVQTHVLNAFALHMGSKLESTPTYHVNKSLFGEDKFLMHKMHGGRCGSDGCFVGVEFSYHIGGMHEKYKTVDVLPFWYDNGRRKAHVVRNAWPLAFKDPKDRFGSRVSTMTDGIQFVSHLPKWFYSYRPGNPSIMVSSDKIRVMVKPD